MSGWEQRIATGNPQADQATVEQHRQAAAQRGLAFDAQPLPAGGYHVRAYPAQAASGPPQGGAYAVPGGVTFSNVSTPGGVLVGGRTATPALTQERVQYLRKVYGLLFASVLVAGIAGWAALSLGPVGHIHGTHIKAPFLVAFLLSGRFAWYILGGALFLGTLAASKISRVRGVNVVALFGVAALVGAEVAPMIFVAQYLSHMGRTLSGAPVLGTFMLVGGVFAGATGYVFVTRKDFSYLYATLSMGFFVVFGGLILAVFLHCEVFTLAVSSVGAIVSAGFLLVLTSRIFRNSAMDDAVGDCLALLVQLDNLFVFILRILMSSRR